MGNKGVESSNMDVIFFFSCSYCITWLDTLWRCIMGSVGLSVFFSLLHAAFTCIFVCSVNPPTLWKGKILNWSAMQCSVCSYCHCVFFHNNFVCWKVMCICTSQHHNILMSVTVPKKRRLLLNFYATSNLRQFTVSVGMHWYELPIWSAYNYNWHCNQSFCER